ncbi:MAG TPA: rubredoxin [Desulfotomaculum sp.]|nr:rubredoxin [Desulfotomaculum sp.]
MKKWKCSICGYVYNPETSAPPGETVGAAKCGYVDEDGDLKSSFMCSRCGAGKESFKSL